MKKKCNIFCCKCGSTDGWIGPCYNIMGDDLIWWCSTCGFTRHTPTFYNLDKEKENGKS